MSESQQKSDNRQSPTEQGPPLAIPTMPTEQQTMMTGNHPPPPPHPNAGPHVMVHHQIPPQHQIPIQIANNGQQQFIIPQHPAIIQHPPPPQSQHPHPGHPQTHHPSQQPPNNGQSIHPQHPHHNGPPPRQLFSYILYFIFIIIPIPSFHILHDTKMKHN